VCFCFILHSCCITVSAVGWTWWDWSLILRTYLPSVLWHCWLGHLTRKNPSPIWPVMCLLGRSLNLAQSNPTQCHWAVWGYNLPHTFAACTTQGYNEIHIRLSTLKFCFLYSLLLQSTNCWISGDVSPNTLFSLSLRYLFVLLTDDDSDVDECWWNYWVTQ